MTRGAGVALVFGAPVTRLQFEQLACAERYWDYGQLMQAGRASWAARFDAHYAPTAAVVSDLCRLAGERGHTVYQRATLRDLRQACAAHAIVIVSAHWKSSHVLEADFLPGWEAAWVALLREGVHPLARLLANRLGHAVPERHRLRDELNVLIRSHQLRPYMPGGLDGPVETGTLILEAVSREIIDLAFAGALRSGNCLELYDGLYSAAEVRAAIGDAMPDVLDLSCCTSSVLATFLREREEQHIIGGDALVIPAPHLRMVQWVLANLGPDLDDYVELRLAVARALRDGHQRGEIKASAPIIDNN